jgi:DHA2 family multidrug resistance protein
MGFGMGLVFIPLVNMTLSTIKKENMGNATAVFNLLRNLGGSFGVAFITTFLARRAQFHQARFSESLNPFDMRFQVGVNKAMDLLHSKGISSEMSANGIIYQRLVKEANMNSFIDTFYISTLIFLCILPFVFLMKKARHADAVMGAHG